MTTMARVRLMVQGLISSRFASPLDVVSWLGAVQAQDYPAALWALGLRLPGATVNAVERPIRDKQVIRTWLMRGTLHFAVLEDVGWMLGLFAPVMLPGHARRNRELGLDEATLARSSVLLHEAVRGGQSKSRRELFALLDAEGLDSTNQRGIYMLVRASYEGRIAQSVQLGRDPVFFALDEVSPPVKFDRTHALAEMARRYFASHGPATLQDFVWWSGLKVSEARAGLDGVRHLLTAESVDGHEYWSADAAPTPATDPVAFLLPAYDEYLIGYQDRSASLAPEYAARVKNANGLGATVVYDGQVIGTWTREAKRAGVTIHAEPFSPWSKEALLAVETAVARYGAFIGQATILDVRD